MITIKEVAAIAGVSTTTVSHVINNTRFVSQELRERVLSVMAELDYQPNSLARSLRRRESHTLGMILPDSTNPFFAEIAYYIQDVGFESGYNTILCNSGGDLAKELIYSRVLIEKRVDGIIFIAVGMSTDHIRAIQEREIPIVVVDRDLPDIKVDAVLVDNFEGGRLATTHLISVGHRRIGCIIGPSDLTPSSDRYKGYLIALEQAHIAVDKNLVRRGDFQFFSGAQAMKELLALPEPPTAVFACNDLMAIAAIHVAQEHQFRVPEDLSIIGYDNIPLGMFTSPPLTTIEQPMREIGKIAIELLLNRMENRDKEPQRFLLPTQLIVRDSTRK